ncbi:hypothetical protein BAZSYMA_ACONTIG54434_1 [Bathymodiolus azoricus thioautotrophic gill symbiont]|uniref:Uncharacterized protein n=1 Tax=Bathymodiolus azoricus thioautotrophic gill symbiont TaxID=235205 RepID=A0A1H6M9R5_9GAMM|nr:hypothetical protein BAZSYMA_ACONTIG54434_1 [Bathymodiolus azoricus thioautotrophic gill symbiont]
MALKHQKSKINYPKLRLSFELKIAICNLIISNFVYPMR